jgi:hypothetical protein
MLRRKGMVIFFFILLLVAQPVVAEGEDDWWEKFKRWFEEWVKHLPPLFTRHPATGAIVSLMMAGPDIACASGLETIRSAQNQISKEIASLTGRVEERQRLRELEEIWKGLWEFKNKFMKACEGIEKKEEKKEEGLKEVKCKSGICLRVEVSKLDEEWHKYVYTLINKRKSYWDWASERFVSGAINLTIFNLELRGKPPIDEVSTSDPLWRCNLYDNNLICDNRIRGGIDVLFPDENLTFTMVAGGRVGRGDVNIWTGFGEGTMVSYPDILAPEPEEEGACRDVSQFVEEYYAAHTSPLPEQIVAYAMHGEPINILYHSSSGEVNVGAMVTEKGRLGHFIIGGGYPGATRQVIFDEETCLKIVRSEDPEAAFRNAWGRDIRLQGLTPMGKVGSGLLNLGMALFAGEAKITVGAPAPQKLNLFLPKPSRISLPDPGVVRGVGSALKLVIFQPQPPLAEPKNTCYVAGILYICYENALQLSKTTVRHGDTFEIRVKPGSGFTFTDGDVRGIALDPKVPRGNISLTKRGIMRPAVTIKDSKTLRVTVPGDLPPGEYYVSVFKETGPGRIDEYADARMQTLRVMRVPPPQNTCIFGGDIYVCYQNSLVLEPSTVSHGDTFEVRVKPGSGFTFTTSSGRGVRGIVLKPEVAPGTISPAYAIMYPAARVLGPKRMVVRMQPQIPWGEYHVLVIKDTGLYALNEYADAGATKLRVQSVPKGRAAVCKYIWGAYVLPYPRPHYLCPQGWQFVEGSQYHPPRSDITYYNCTSPCGTVVDFCPGGGVLSRTYPKRVTVTPIETVQCP